MCYLGGMEVLRLLAQVRDRWEPEQALRREESHQANSVAHDILMGLAGHRA